MQGIPITEFADIQQITVNMTESCNLDCTYCYTQGHSAKAMSLDTITRMFNWFKDSSAKYKHVHCKILGGEPLLDFDLFKQFVEIGKKTFDESGRHISFSTVSNGTLLTEEKVQWLTDNCIKIAVSMDGTKEAHNKCRSNSWDNTVRGLKLLEAVRGSVSIRMTITPETSPYFYDSVKDLKEMFPKLHISVAPVGVYNWDEEVYKEWERQIFKALDAGIKLSPDPNPRSNKKYLCGSCIQMVTVGADGTIYSCHRMDKFSDKRPWHEKEWALGHIDHGITKPKLYLDILQRPLKVKYKSCIANCVSYSGNIYVGANVGKLWHDTALQILERGV